MEMICYRHQADHCSENYSHLSYREINLYLPNNDDNNTGVIVAFGPKASDVSTAVFCSSILSCSILLSCVQTADGIRAERQEDKAEVHVGLRRHGRRKTRDPGGTKPMARLGIRCRIDTSGKLNINSTKKMNTTDKKTCTKTNPKNPEYMCVGSFSLALCVPYGH